MPARKEMIGYEDGKPIFGDMESDKPCKEKMDILTEAEFSEVNKA